MRDFIKVMKALKAPQRVKIVKMLQYGELCVCEIQAAIRLSQSSVSKHLRVMEEAGLLDSRKEGLWVYYRLHDGSRSPYAAAMLGNLTHWLRDAPEIEEIVKKLPDIRQANLCRR